MQQRLASMSGSQVLDHITVFCDAASGLERLPWFQGTLGMNQWFCWCKTGGQIPPQRVMESMWLCAEPIMRSID